MHIVDNIIIIITIKLKYNSLDVKCFSKFVAEYLFKWFKILARILNHDGQLIMEMPYSRWNWISTIGMAINEMATLDPQEGNLGLVCTNAGVWPFPLTPNEGA